MPGTLILRFSSYSLFRLRCFQIHLSIRGLTCADRACLSSHGSSFALGFGNQEGLGYSAEIFEMKEHEARGTHVHIKSLAVRKTVRIKTCNKFGSFFNQLISDSERPFFSSKLADTPVNIYIHWLSLPGSQWRSVLWIFYRAGDTLNEEAVKNGADCCSPSLRFESSGKPAPYILTALVTDTSADPPDNGQQQFECRASQSSQIRGLYSNNIKRRHFAAQLRQEFSIS